MKSPQLFNGGFVLNSYKYQLIAFILILSTNVFAKSIDRFKADLNIVLKENKTRLREWKLLKSSGWRIHLTNSKKTITIVYGKPFSFKNYSKLVEAKNALRIAVSNDDKISDQEIIKGLLPQLTKLINHKATERGWRVKFGSKIKEASVKVHDSIGWPEEDIDALGTGYDEHFKKIGNLAHTSWRIKRRKKPSLFFNSIMNYNNDEEYLYTSGCLVTLGALLNTGAFLTFDEPKIYDKSFPTLYINNSKFRKTSLSFLEAPEQDIYGSYHARFGARGVIGVSGYFNAVLDDVFNKDYYGENIVIIEMSESAAKELYDTGLGYYQSEYVLTKDDFKEFSGLSKRMIEWWKVFTVVYNKLAGDMEYDAKKVEKIAKKAIKLIETDPIYKKAYAKINTPFFNDTVMFGHDSGAHTAKAWLYELATINPNTPFALFFYDYNIERVLWKKFKKAYLTFSF